MTDPLPVTPIPDLLGLADVPLLVLEHPPLRLALCQVSFPTDLAVADASFVAPFQKAIQSEYPDTKRVEGIQLEFSIPPSQFRPPQPIQNWQFGDVADTWQVVLAQGFVTLETRAYSTFEDFLDRLHRLLSALIEHIRPGFVTRIGLRYINEIRSPALGWEQIIRPEMLGCLSVRELIRNAEQTNTMSEMVFRYPGKRGVNIRHGLLPGGTTVQPRPSETVSPLPFYLLDLDVFREFALQEAPMQPDVVCEQVREFNLAIYRLFRWAVTSTYLDTLGVRDAGS